MFLQNKRKSILQLLKFIMRNGFYSTCSVLLQAIQATKLEILSTNRDGKISLKKRLPKKDKVFFGVKNDIIFNEFKDGIFREVHFLQILSYFEFERGTLLDIGANHGTHTVALSEHFPQCEVISFEPNPRIFPLLQLNTITLSNVTTLNLAVSNETGKLRFIEGTDFSRNMVNSGMPSLIGPGRVSKKRGGLAIDSCVTVTIDDLVLNEVKFVKIDAQGSEFLCMKGMKNTILRNEPIIYFECEEPHLNRQGTTSLEVLNFVSSLNYQLYRIETEYPTDHLAIPASQVSKFEEQSGLTSVKKRTKKSTNLKKIPCKIESLRFRNRNYYDSINESK